MAQIIGAIRGRAKLMTVFWGYCILGTIAVGMLVFCIFRAAILFDPSPHHVSAQVSTSVFFVTYFLWAHVSLWTCAFNVNHRGWGYAARSYAVMASFIISSRFPETSGQNR